MRVPEKADDGGNDGADIGKQVEIIADGNDVDHTDRHAQNGQPAGQVNIYGKQGNGGYDAGNGREDGKGAGPGIQQRGGIEQAEDHAPDGMGSPTLPPGLETEDGVPDQAGRAVRGAGEG